MNYELTDLGPGEPVSINNAGVIVGNAVDGAWVFNRGFRQTLKFEARYVGAPTGMYFTAYSVDRITDAGKIYGKVMLVPRSTTFVSFTYNSANNVLLDVPLPAFDPPIGNVGFTTVGETRHATGNGVDLNYQVTALGWVLNVATGSNAAGQIIGYGTKDGVKHGFLLTPSPAATATPSVGGGTLSIRMVPMVSVQKKGPCEVLYADSPIGPWKTLFKADPNGAVYDYVDLSGSQNRLYKLK